MTLSNPALHVVPMGDLIEHYLNDGCACGPTTEPVKREDGSVGWVVTHHSLDGREKSEDPSPGWTTTASGTPKPLPDPTPGRPVGISRPRWWSRIADQTGDDRG